MVAPSWAVSGGNLYVGLFPQVVAAAAAHGAGKGKTLLDNPDFAALRRRLGGERACSVSFMDLPRTAPDAYTQWLMASRLAGFGDLFGVQSPPMIVPPLNQLMPHLAPAGSVGWADKDGFHVRAVSPFPGSTALASDPLAGYGAALPMMLFTARSAEVRRANAQAEAEVQRARAAERERAVEREPAPPAPPVPPAPPQPAPAPRPPVPPRAPVPPVPPVPPGR